MPLVPGTRVGAYEVIAKVGEGGMGSVYRARDLHLGREVALKILPDDLAADENRRDRFHREARALAALNHPHIAIIHGWEESDGRTVIVMEFVDGHPLSEIIGRAGLALDRAIRYALQIASALIAAHHAGIMHRDLKPSNIMVSAAGDIKLVDFGLARSTAEHASQGEVTRASSGRTSLGVIVGTPAYMSPEQAQGVAVDHRTDLFSFGAVLYEMCTGRPPFNANTPTGTLAAILKDEPEPPSRARGELLPSDLERLILKCLRKDPDRRVQTAADLRVSLEDVRDVFAQGANAIDPPQRRGAPPRAMSLLLAALALLAGVAIGWTIRSRPLATSPTPPLRQLTSEAGVALTPALSPDGRLLAYASDRAGDGVLDLWVKQVAGGDPVRATSGIGGVSNPQFSPDGTKVYVLGYQNDIFEVSTLGGAPHKAIERAGPFSVSSTGEIAFAQIGTGGAASTIQIVSAPGSAAVPWRPECEAITAPAWSPDGRRLAFVGRCREATGLYVAPREGGTATRIAIREPYPMQDQASTETLTPSRLRGFIGWSSLGWFRATDGREGVLAAWREGDTININRLYFDGTREPLTRGTGWETSAAAATNGAVAFMRSEMTPTVWSLPIDQPVGTQTVPRHEVAPATLFAVSKDGRLMTFGRILGPDRGELRAKRLDGGEEIVLASQSVANWGIGSFWGPISADGQRVFYRLNLTARNTYFLVPTAGGTPRELSISDLFTLGTQWVQRDSRVLGECRPTTKGVCAVDPVSSRVTIVTTDPQGAELLNPTLSWDGRWMTFMRRLAGSTTVYVAPIGDDLAPRPFGEWVPVSPRGLTGARPRFAPDGRSIFYLLTDRGTVALVRQAFDPATKHPVGEPTRIATIQMFPTTLSYSFGASASIIDVTQDRVYFNTIDLRSNVWLTGVQ